MTKQGMTNPWRFSFNTYGGRPQFSINCSDLSPFKERRVCGIESKGQSIGCSRGKKLKLFFKK
jgi:hypothetical protein